MVANEENGPVEINSQQTFRPDPLYHLMGIFDDPSSGSDAVGRLGDAGFSSADITLFCGVEGAASYDFSGNDHGLGATLLRNFRNITFDRVIMERYEQALKTGHCVLMVRVNKTERKLDASEIMEASGAKQVEYFGLATTEAFPHHDAERPDPDAMF